MFEKIAALRAQWRYAFVALGLLGALASVSVTNAVDAVPPDGGRGQPVTPLATPNSEHGSNNCEPSPEQQRRMDGAREYVKKNGIEGFDLKWDCVSNGPVLVTKEIPEGEEEPLIVAYFDPKGDLNSFWVEVDGTGRKIFHGAKGAFSWLIVGGETDPNGKDLGELIKRHNASLLGGTPVILPRVIERQEITDEAFTLAEKKLTKSVVLSPGVGLNKKYVESVLTGAVKFMAGLDSNEFGDLQAMVLAGVTNAKVSRVEVVPEPTMFIQGGHLQIGGLTGDLEFDSLNVAANALVHELGVHANQADPLEIYNGAMIFYGKDKLDKTYVKMRPGNSKRNLDCDFELVAYYTTYQAIKVLVESVHLGEKGDYLLRYMLKRQGNDLVNGTYLRQLP